MIKLLWRTDVHLSDRSPSSRKDEWTETVFTKLGQVKAVARKLHVDAVLDGGDFFHIKSPSRNSHRIVRMAAEHHADYPCPVYCTPGNHDSIYGDYEFLGQQPLGVLFAAGTFQRLYDEHELLVERGGLTVRVVGIPYHGTSYDMDRIRAIRKGGEDYLVVVAHLLASPKGGTMFENEDVLKYSELADLDPDVWLFGHWHKDQGVTEVKGKTFVNLGSLTRGALTQDDMERRPAIALLSFDPGEGMSVQTLRLRVQDAEDVFDLDAKVRAEARSMTMDAFVASVRETLIDAKAESLEDTVRASEDIPAQIRERAIHYLEQV